MRSIRWSARCTTWRRSAHGEKWPAGELLREYPLRPELLAVTRAWDGPERGRNIVAAKGAPEAIAQLCRMNSEDLAALRSQVDELAHEGMRVLGVARAELAATALPGVQTEIRFDYLGLVGFADPVRDNGSRGGARVPLRGHPRHHDHR